ncbi:MAG: FCD domain-containing protein, partial [Pseudomonadota bacterium]
LNAHMEAEHAAIAAEDKGRALALSGEFHLEIANIAAHDVFTDFVKSLVKRSSLIIALYWKRPDTTCESHSHHALIDALAQKNESEAEEIMRSHIVDLHSGLNLTPTNDASISVSQILGG